MIQKCSVCSSNKFVFVNMKSEIDISNGKGITGICENGHKTSFFICFDDKSNIYLAVMFHENINLYKEYIKSEKWLEKSKKAKERVGYRCQLCNKEGDNHSLHAHHRTYERLGNEWNDDITILCGDCHAKFHDVVQP